MTPVENPTTTMQATMTQLQSAPQIYRQEISCGLIDALEPAAGTPGTAAAIASGGWPMDPEEPFPSASESTDCGRRQTHHQLLHACILIDARLTRIEISSGIL